MLALKCRHAQWHYFAQIREGRSKGSARFRNRPPQRQKQREEVWNANHIRQHSQIRNLSHRRSRKLKVRKERIPVKTHSQEHSPIYGNEDDRGDEKRVLELAGMKVPSHVSIKHAEHEKTSPEKDRVEDGPGD